MAEDLKFDLELQSSSPDTKQPKVIFAGDQYDGQALLSVEEGDIGIFADRTNGISISEGYGTLISGPLHIASMPHEISFGGGYWRLDIRHLSTLPSTTPTPIPLLVKSTPDLLRYKSDFESHESFLEANSDIA